MLTRFWFIWCRNYKNSHLAHSFFNACKQFNCQFMWLFMSCMHSFFFPARLFFCLSLNTRTTNLIVRFPKQSSLIWMIQIHVWTAVIVVCMWVRGSHVCLSETLVCQHSVARYTLIYGDVLSSIPLVVLCFHCQGRQIYEVKSRHLGGTHFSSKPWRRSQLSERSCNRSVVIDGHWQLSAFSSILVCWLNFHTLPQTLSPCWAFAGEISVWSAHSKICLMYFLPRLCHLKTCAGW